MKNKDYENLIVILMIMGLVIVLGIMPWIFILPKIQEEAERDLLNQGQDNNVRESTLVGMDEKLKYLDFIQVTDKISCQIQYKCFYKDSYSIKYADTGWLVIEKEIKDINSYDTSEDLELIGKMYNNDKIASRSQLLNKIIKNDFPSFFLNMDTLHFYISVSSNGISYSIGDYYVYDDLKSDIDRFDGRMSKEYIRENLLEATFGDYKNTFPLYDFENNYIKYIKDRGIEIRIKESNFEYYIGYASSYYSYAYEVKDYSIPNTDIEVTIPGEYFEGDSINMITADLKYFTNKYDKKYELSPKDIDSIRSFVSSNKNSLWLTINYNLDLRITNHADGISYTIRYTH